MNMSLLDVGAFWPCADSLLGVCRSLRSPRVLLPADRLMRLLCGRKGSEQAFALQRIGVEPNGEWAVVDELDLHHRAE